MSKDKPIFRVIIDEYEKDENGKKTDKLRVKKIKINGEIKEVECRGGVVLDRLNEALGYNFNDKLYDSNGNRLSEFMQFNWLDGGEKHEQQK